MHGCKTLGGLAQGWFEVPNAQPGQGGLYPIHNPRAFPDQAVALAVRPLGVLFGNRGHARHAAMAPFATQPPQEPALQQLGVEPVGFRAAMLPRYRDTRGMDHVRLYSTRRKPARQPEAVAASFEGQRNPRDRAAGPDRLIPPAMQQAKQSFRARFELLARLTFNAGKHAGNQPARLAQLNDGNDRAILVQGDEGPAQSLPRRRPGSFGWGIAGTPSIRYSDEVAISRRPPHSIFRFLVEPRSAPGPCRTDSVGSGVIRSGALRLQRAAQDLASRLGAVQRAQGAAPDFPALVGAHELPAIGRNTMDVDAARRAMIGDVEQRTDTVRHEDLQIGYCERRVAGDPHIGQAGKMRDPLLDRAVVLGVRGPAGDRRPSGRPGEFGATVEHAVLGLHRSRVI